MIDNTTNIQPMTLLELYNSDHAMTAEEFEEKYGFDYGTTDAFDEYDFYPPFIVDYDNNPDGLISYATIDASFEEDEEDFGKTKSLLIMVIDPADMCDDSIKDPKYFVVMEGTYDECAKYYNDRRAEISE